MNTWEYELLLNIRHSAHKYQDMGPCICFLYMLYHLDNHCSVHILVDSLCMDLLDIQVGMYIHHYYTEHLDHTVKDCMDLFGLAQFVVV